MLDFFFERDFILDFFSYDKVLDVFLFVGKIFNVYLILCKIIGKGGEIDRSSCENLIKILNEEGNTK